VDQAKPLGKQLNSCGTSIFSVEQSYFLWKNRTPWETADFPQNNLIFWRKTQLLGNS